ncbi:MAG: AAA family ATPase [Opitutaceae bacterium]
MDSNKKRFGVSLSFSGENRNYVEAVANKLAKQLGRERILYDHFYEAEFAKPNLDVWLPNLYKDQSELIAIFLCDGYKNKRWCGLEWRAIRQLIQTKQERSIMFISFGDHGDLGDIGIYAGDGYLDIRSRSPEEISLFILQRYQEISGSEIEPNIITVSEEKTKQLQEFVGKQRQSILDFFNQEWLQAGTGVAVIQGFSGAGKTQLASEIAENSGFPIVAVNADAELADPSQELLLTLSAELMHVGISQLEDELDRGDEANLLRTLETVLKYDRVLIVIDEFQCLFRANKSKLLPKWQRLIESLNNSRSLKGKLLLISNRQFEHETWNENCVIKRLDGLEPQEAKTLITKLLEEKNRGNDIPKQLREEIGRRLGGNPRAIKTLVGSLGYGSLDELMSFAPSITKSEDLFVSPELLEKFERELIERSLMASQDTLKAFMRKISAYRKPFKKEAIATDEVTLRDQLIDRFLLEFHSGNYTIHPLAHEINITRLREDHQKWTRAHSVAADYYLRHFKAKKLSAGGKLSISYLELRYHLHESERMHELAMASCKLADYALASISVRLLTKPPENTIVLEERISLISSLSNESRSKRLEYHLALCLKTRNIGDDYKHALMHARKAVGPKAYYAYWLLLIELEYAVNGSAGLTKSYRSAVQTLSEASNLSQIYKLVAELYEKDNQEERAVEALQEAIGRNLPSGNDSLIRKCAELLEHLDRMGEAISLLRDNLEIPDFDHRSILFRHCAELLAKSSRAEEAIKLLKSAIEIPQMTYLVHCYLDIAQYYELLELPTEATKWLQTGVKDKRVKHKDKLHRRHAEILADHSQPDNALSELALRIEKAPQRESLRLYHSYAQLAERAGKSSDAIKLLKAAVKKRGLSKEPSLYLVCSDLYFHLTDLENAIRVLRNGISAKELKDKSDLYTKLADLLHRQDKTDQAIKTLEESEGSSSISNRFSIFKKHSELLVKAGRIDDAISLNKDAINSPALTNKAVIYQSLSKLLFDHRSPEAALDKLKEALEDPSLTAKVMIYHTYAKMLEKVGRTDDGVELLKGAINGPKMGNVVSLYKLCGELAGKSGDKDFAIDILNRGIELYPKEIGLKKALSDVS